MMNTKTFFSTLFVSVLCTTVMAQGFSSFKPEAAIVQTLIKNNNKPELNSVVETIVLGDCDMTNLPVKYKLLSNCSFDATTPLSANYTKVQEVTIEKKGEGTKNWNVIVHQLKSAALPLHINFSKENPCDLNFTNPKPWAGYGIDYSKPSVVRFGNSGVGFFVAYEGAAKEVSFDFDVVAKVPFDGEFDVESSIDGKKWKNLITYSASNPFTGRRQIVALPSDARFVRFVYAVRVKQNVNINSIEIK